MSIQHNSTLTLIKSGAPFFRIDMIHMVHLNVKYFSVVSLGIYHEKLPVKTTLKTIKKKQKNLKIFQSNSVGWTNVAYS